MELELKGINELVAKLEKIRHQAAGPGTLRALRAGGNVIKGFMEDRAPVLDKKTTGSNALPPGALKAGIRVAVDRSSPIPEVLIGPNSKVSHVARWVEYGHRNVRGGYSKTLGNGKSRGPGKASEADTPAYPFLRPAFEASVSAAKGAIRASLIETIQEAQK